MQHSQFQIDGIDYQLSSDCHAAVFPNLLDRVQKHLIRYGAFAAKDMIGQATVEGKTKFGCGVLAFKLTINPQGIVL